MDKLSRLKILLRKVAGDNLQLPFVATVVSIEADSCTIRLFDEDKNEETGVDFTISDVNLRATIAEDDNADGLLLIPKEDSDVLVLSLDGTLDNLSVIKVNEVDSIQIKKEKLVAKMDIENASFSINEEESKNAFKYDVTNSTFNISKESNLFDMDFASGAFKMENKGGGVFEVGDDGKFSIGNNSGSLLDVLKELVTTLKSFKVITPTIAGPTPNVSIDPGTTASITQVETLLGQLLK